MSTKEYREINDRIQAQVRRFLLEVAKVFLVFGGIVLFGWGIAAQRASVFKVNADLLAEGELPLFDVHAVASLPARVKLVHAERTPNSGPDRAWACEWMDTSGVRINLWILDSFGLEPKRSELSGMDPGLRSKNLFDSLVGSSRVPGSPIERMGEFRDFEADRMVAPPGAILVMRSGAIVGQWRTYEPIDYIEALELARRVGFIEAPVVPVGGWNRLRLNLDLWAAGFSVLAACLWMWQILTAGTRAARLEASENPSAELLVAEGLRTLAGLHPAIGLNEAKDGRWIVSFIGRRNERFQQRTESAEILHEFRIWMHHSKAIVVESVKAKKSASEANTLSLGLERSRILPMIEIPRGSTLSIKPSREGFRLQMDSIEPEDLRYALVVFFLIHGWGWEPRLFWLFREKCG
jgi:hypothetical protein